MIECLKYKKHEKDGCLLGFADVYDDVQDWEVRGIKLFMKDGKRWIQMPSSEFQTPEGEKAYNPIVKKREKANVEQYGREVIKAIEVYCATNRDDKQDVPF